LNKRYNYRGRGQRHYNTEESTTSKSTRKFCFAAGKPSTLETHYALASDQAVSFNMPQAAMK